VARQPEAVARGDRQLQPLDRLRAELDDPAAAAALQVVVVLAPERRLEAPRLAADERRLQDPGLDQQRQRAVDGGARPRRRGASRRAPARRT
jgi:hypothetical protein